MRAMRFVGSSLLAGALAATGCGGGLSFAVVEGTVKVNGQPVDKIQVEFWPAGDGPRSIGVTDANGRYTLASDDGSKPGAVVGRHKVVLRDVGIMGDQFLGRAGETVDMTKGKKPRVSATYAEVTRTPIEKDVAAGKNQIDIDAAP